MTSTHQDTPPGVRVLTDGGRDTEPAAMKTTTVKADGVTTTEIDGEERDVLRVPISSTRTDREGDRFSKDALEGMADQIRVDQPRVFDNHGLAGSWMDAIPYDADAAIGTQFDADVEEADDGEHELFALVNPNLAVERGERMLKEVRDEKQAVKFSVGFGIKDEEPIEDEAGNEIGREFIAADLMETSRVGIPANPDASVTTAAAKGGAAALPGFAMHPVFQARAGLPRVEDLETEDHGFTEEYNRVAAKGAGGDSPKRSPHVNDAIETLAEALGRDTEDIADAVGRGGTPDAVDDIRTEVAELRGVVEELRETIAADDADGSKGSCESDDDCPDGEVCVDGECVDEDSVDAAATSDASSEDLEALREENAALREDVTELREAVQEGAASPDSADTTTEEPDLTNEGGEPDATTNDADTDAGQPATDFARSNQ